MRHHLTGAAAVAALLAGTPAHGALDGAIGASGGNGGTVSAETSGDYDGNDLVASCDYTAIPVRDPGTGRVTSIGSFSGSAVATSAYARAIDVRVWCEAVTSRGTFTVQANGRNSTPYVAFARDTISAPGDARVDQVCIVTADATWDWEHHDSAHTAACIRPGVVAGAGGVTVAVPLPHG